MSRLLLDGGKEEDGYVRGDQEVPIHGKNRVIPDGIVHEQAQELAKQEVVLQLFYQKAFTANGVKHLDQQGTQRAFSRGNGVKSHLGKVVQ